jgi:hypothetical protein
LALAHDNSDTLEPSTGFVLLENRLIVKGIFRSATVRANDDGFEYLFLSIPQRIVYNSGNIVEVKGTLLQRCNCLYIFVEQTKCLGNADVLFRCIGCNTNYCMQCQTSHNADNCRITFWDWIMIREFKQQKISGWNVVYSTLLNISCGSVSQERLKIHSAQNYYSQQAYYDSESEENPK